MSGDIFDFVIVGGGTAGLVLANRLTEDRNVSVVVLEAGEDLSSHPRVTTPALFATMLGSDADWNVVTEPQEGLNGRHVNIPLGRALGGSSAINGQIFVPTSKIGIDTWEQLGNPGWNWDALVPYFGKSYTLNIPSNPAVHEHLHLEYIDESANGKDGPIQTSFLDDVSNPLPKAWIESLHSLGHRPTGDPISGSFIGAYTNAASIDAKTRQRSYSASAYLKPVQDRPNLTIITGAYVQKIILTGSYPNVIATGVEYLKDAQRVTSRVKEEVILAAGALHSPKLLELSGLGGSSTLKPLGIYPFIDNPNVGENLQDQPMAGISFEVADGIKTVDDMLRLDTGAIQQAMKEYTEKKSGPLAVNGINSHAFLGLPPESQKALGKKIAAYKYEVDASPLKGTHTSYVNDLILNPNESTASFFAYAAQGNFGEGAGSSLMATSSLEGSYYSIAACLLQPLSRGYVHIQSADPSVPVKVNPRYLSHPLDLEVFAQHMTYLDTLTRTPPLSDLLKAGGCRNTAAPKNLGDAKAMKKYLKETALSSWHPTSTCAMLPETKGGVVNERLVVHGTRNLRVVDASIFPITSRGNPMATVYAVAERASDIIKEDFKLRKKH